MAEMSDAEVFGSTAPAVAAPREMSDAEVFGKSPPPTTTPNDISGEGRDEYGQPTRPLAPPAPEEPGTDLLSVAGMRRAMQPAPGYVPTGILPFSLRETVPGSGEADPTSGVGGMRPDWGPVRMVVNPLLDMLEGTGLATSVGGQNAPLAGKVSPEATGLLFGAMAGRINPLARDLTVPGPFRSLTPEEVTASIERNAPLSPEFKASPMAPGAAERMAQPLTPEAPTSVNPNIGPDIPPPETRSVGAAGTPYTLATLTPEEAAAAGSTADKQWLYKGKTPGEADWTMYIDGITPTMAQAEQTTNAARETNRLRTLSPDADQAERTLLSDHSEKRKNFFQETAGSDTTQQMAEKAASDRIDSELGAAFRANGTVDPAGIQAQIAAELASPAGKLPPVKGAMKTLSDALQKDDGSGPETDPRQVYGVHRVANFLLSKQGRLANPGYGDADVVAALTRVKQATAGAIEPAAPGFRDALANYSEAQRAIDAREALQAAEPGLYGGPNNVMRFQSFHNFMKRVIAGRDPNAPLNPFQSLTEDQMNRLKSLHDDLQRVASAEELNKTYGSSTARNLMDIVRSSLTKTIGGGIGGFVGSALGPHGLMAGTLAGAEAANKLVGKVADARNTKKMERMLRPDPAKYPTTKNQLMND
jgi:hypothetical protein